MSFLFPQFLYGLLALSIPIIVHLFNFRRTRKVYFSNTIFLKKVKEASSTKRRLKHYLILLSRLLFIFFLVMAFAQPIIKTGEGLAAQKDVLIYLDNSYSMSNEVEESVTGMDAGVTYINEMLNLFPSATSYRILTNDFDAASRIPKSKIELSDLTTELQYSSTSRSFADIYDRIKTLNEKPQSIYWISDFQKSTSTKNTIDFDSTLQVNLVPMEFVSTANVAVDSIWVDNPFLIGNERLKLNVKIRNYGLEPVDDLILKVFADDIQAATASIDIAANTAVSTTFDLAFQSGGIKKCRISFEEFPVTFDNEFYFTINSNQRLNVLEIKNQDGPTSITKVYGNTQLFKLTSVNINNLDYSLVSQNDLIIINGIPQVEPSLAAIINQRLNQYGSVLMVPAAQPDLASYRQIQGMQQITLKDSLIETELKAPDFQNPFFKDVFEEENKSMAMPSAKKLLDWGPDRTAILIFRNNEPFLSKVGHQENLYVLASPLSADYTSFYAHALFVPVMYRLAVESASQKNRLYYFIDEPILTIKTDTLLTDDIFKLKSGQEEVIPSQRANANQVVMELPRYMLESGFYDLTLGQKKINTFAFNKSFKESDLEQYTRDELKDRFQGNVTVFDANDKGSFSKELKNKYVGKTLWKYALVLALLFLLAEVLLIRFFP